MSLLQHLPVLLNETLALLNLRTGMNAIDGTLGLGGHSKGILEATHPTGRLLGIDRDSRNLGLAQENLADFQKRIALMHGNFSEIAEIAGRLRFSKVSAILLDLGLSSPHVDDPMSGFSFKKEGPLDMRFDRSSSGLTAADILNGYSADRLTLIFRKLGEEPHAKGIAERIVTERKKKAFRTTFDLVAVLPKPNPKVRLHPATRIFQALRMHVNQELEHLEKGLHEAVKLLEPGGRIAVISYHSLEDRLVKNIFRSYAIDCICPREILICQCNFQKTLYLVTKKPIIPSGIEVSTNPRSRSAKLRVAEKIKN